MTGLVFGLGLLLVVIGGVSVVSGAPIIQIERGWAEVIAGAVAISGGVVTFALGVVLLRLEGMRKAMVGRARPVVRQSPAERSSLDERVAVEVPPLPDPIEPRLRPTRAPEDAVAIGGPEPTVAPTSEAPAGTPAPALEGRTSLWKRVIRPARNNPVADRGPAAMAPLGPHPSQESSPPEISVDMPGPVNAPTSADGLPVDVENAISVEGSPHPRRLMTPPTPVADESERTPRTSTYARDWLTQPLLRSRSPKPPEAEPLPPLFETAPERDEGDPPSPVKDEQAAANATEPAVEVEREPTKSSSETPEERTEAEELTVIGRYKAGASSYTMFSDGAIEVETEAGDIHRFASMAELKAFIARQESALS